jgi:hypothetical protein
MIARPHRPSTSRRLSDHTRFSIQCQVTNLHPRYKKHRCRSTNRISTLTAVRDKT